MARGMHLCAATSAVSVCTNYRTSKIDSTQLDPSPLLFDPLKCLHVSAFLSCFRFRLASFHLVFELPNPQVAVSSLTRVRE